MKQAGTISSWECFTVFYQLLQEKDWAAKGIQMLSYYSLLDRVLNLVKKINQLV